MEVAKVSEARHMLLGLEQRLSLLCLEGRAQGGVPCIHSFDRAFGFIDDTLVIINEVVNDKNTPLVDRQDLIELRKMLLLLNEVLEKFGACQSQVLYLHPLLRQTQKEGDLTQWADFMAGLERESYCVRTLATEATLDRLGDMSLTFERLSLGLGLLIERHEAHFHRFYVCTADEVLSVVSNATAPDDKKIAALQPFIRSLYNFQQVRTKPDDPSVITHVACETGDVMQLMDPVLTAGRQFHQWAPILSAQVVRSVHQEVAHVLRGIDDGECWGMRHWGTLGNGQAALVAIHVLFTQRVETVFKQYSQFYRGGSAGDGKITQAFVGVRDELRERLADLLLWARRGSRTARTVHMISSYARFVHGVTALIDGKVTSRHDARWLRQLRCYFAHVEDPTKAPPAATHGARPNATPGIDEFLAHPAAVPGDRRKSSLLLAPGKAGRRRRTMDPSAHRDCEIAMGCYSDDDAEDPPPPTVHIRWELYMATVDFQGEFAALPPTSGICPVGEAVLEKLLHCCHDHYAGCTVVAPCNGYDPRRHRGVDPVALVTNAAMLFGKHCHVYHCTPQTASASVIRALLGAFASGLWLVLRGVDRLDPTVISLINEGVSAVRSALRSDSPTYQFEGKVIALESRSFAVFAVREESDDKVSDVGRVCLQTLQKSLPPVALPVVPLEEVFKQAFMQVGIDDESGMLGHYAASVVQRATHSFGLNEPRLVEEFRQTLPHVVDVVSVHEQPVSAVVHTFYKTVLRQIPTSKYATFHDIMRSCFGATEGVDIPGPADEAPLDDQAREKIEIRLLHKLMATPKPFLKKCEQLHEAMLCGFPVVLTGPTGSGKTSLWRAVYEACFATNRSDTAFIYLSLHDAKSLFGKCDEQHEWTDGLFTHAFRKAAALDAADPDGACIAAVALWIVFDGLPSPDVLQTLLPVLDPNNRCLTLETGEVIRGPPGLRVIFETTSLDVPAALAARAALIRTDGGMLEARHYITHLAAQPGFFLSTYRERVETVLGNLAPAILAWAEASNLVRDWNDNKFPTDKPMAQFPINCANLVQACFNVINGFHNKRRGVAYTLNDDEKGITEACVEPILMFSCVWSFGAALAFNHQQMVAFNSYFRNLIIDKGLSARFPMPQGDELGLVFDYVYEVEQRTWLRWSSLRDPSFTRTGQNSADSSRPATTGSTVTCGSKNDPPPPLDDKLIVETAANRMTWVLRHLADKGVPVMLAGAPASGKSELVESALRSTVKLYCAGTTPKLLQQTAGARLQKSRDNVIRLPDRLPKPLTLMLDSLELADRASLDFLRQMRDLKGWYDPFSNDRLEVKDIAFAAAVDQQGVLQFSARQLQQFHFVSLVEPTYDELVQLIRDRLDCVMMSSQRSEAAHDVRDELGKVANLIMEVHVEVQQRFPRKNDARYLWTLACIDQVVTGIKHANLRTIGKLEDMLRLVINECLFSFAGRFEQNSEEKRIIENVVWELTVMRFKPLTRSDILKVRNTLCFGGVGEYRDYLSEDEFKAYLAGQSVAYEKALTSDVARVRQRKLQELVRDGMDTSVMRNMADLLRALNAAPSHVVLLAEGVDANIDEISLALFMSNVVLARPATAECHTQADLRHTLKYLCLSAFISTRPIAVLLDERFLPLAGIADVVALAKHGELPGLFSSQDWHCITQTVAARNPRGTSAGLRGRDAIRKLFRATLKESLRFLLIRDPMSKSFDAVTTRHVDAVTHFTFLSLARSDKQHLKLISAPLKPDAVALETSMKMYVEVRELMARSPSVQAVNIDVSAGSLIKHLLLYPKVLADLERANSLQQEKYRTCIAMAQNNKDEGAGDGKSWAQVEKLWQGKLAKLETAREPLYGDALLMSAFVTWGAAAPGGVFLKRCAEVLLQSDVNFTSFADLKCVYNAAHPEAKTDLWVQRGLHPSAVLPAITLKYAPSHAVVLLDPHHIAVSSIRTVYHGEPIKVLYPPYTESILKVLSGLEVYDGVVVLHGMSTADLESSWLKAKLMQMHHASAGDLDAGEVRPTMQGEKREAAPIAPGFKLFIIPEDAAVLDQHPGHVKMTCSVVPFDMPFSTVQADATATAIQRHRPLAAGTSEGKVLQQRLEAIEEELTGQVVSGAGAAAAAAKNAADTVGVLKLLREAEAAAEAVNTYTKEHRRRSSMTSAPDAAHYRAIGTNAAVFLTALERYKALNPTALLGASFYNSATDDVLAVFDSFMSDDASTASRANSARPSTGSNPLSAPPSPATCCSNVALKAMFAAAAPALGDGVKQLQFAWLLLLTREGADNASHQTTPRGGGSVHSSPCVSPKVARLKWDHKRSFRGAPEQPQVKASIQRAMQPLVTSYPMCDDQPDRLLEYAAAKVKRDLSTSAARPPGLRAEAAVRELLEAMTPPKPLLVVGSSDIFLPVMRRIVDGVTDPAVQRKIYFVAAADSLKTMARSLITDAVAEGGWVIVSDLLVSPDFTSELDQICHDLAADDAGTPVHSGFKLILQSEASANLPAPLLERAEKFCLDPVEGFWAGVSWYVEENRGYFDLPSSTSRISDPKKLAFLSKVIPCLILFHVVVEERQRQGWLATTGVSFTATVLTASVASFINALRRTPANILSFDLVRYTTVNIVYGARLSCTEDLAVLQRIGEEAIHPPHPETGVFTLFGMAIPNVEHGFPQYAAERAGEESPTPLSVLSLTEADVMRRQRYLGNQFFADIAGLRKYSSNSMRFDWARLEVFQVVDYLMHEVVPAKFDVHQAFEWLQEANTAVLSTIYPILQPELHRYNAAITVMQRDLARLKQVLDGRAALDEQVVAVARALGADEVPAEWLVARNVCTAAYDGQIPVAGGLFVVPPLRKWTRTVTTGYNFFHAWAVEGNNPNVIDLESLIHPASLFFSCVDTVAFAEGIPSSELHINLHIVPESCDPITRANNLSTFVHVSGVHINGAEWNPDTHRLERPTSRACAPLPTLFITCTPEPQPPAENEDGSETPWLPLPLYTNFSFHQMIATVWVPASPDLDRGGVYAATQPW
eukprot:TRINITY_DN3722_c0_g1_i1.p1 TRINITY_DN3722_c0_g1~~TRINITY_DN3722_c0_g1_i1.p1  ORF type:complete len:3001 (+),score=1029.16 TRINITY_DN3722_c0_g1_i1:116-9118(+)